MILNKEVAGIVNKLFKKIFDIDSLRSQVITIPHIKVTLFLERYRNMHSAYKFFNISRQYHKEKHISFSISFLQSLLDSNIIYPVELFDLHRHVRHICYCYNSYKAIGNFINENTQEAITEFANIWLTSIGRFLK